MIIKVLLILALVVALIWFLAHHNSTKMRAWKKVGVLVFIIFAVANVTFPNTSNRIANALGVGRGADLVTYVNAIAFVFLSLNLYLRTQNDDEKLVKLSRKMALLEAELQKTKNNQ